MDAAYKSEVERLLAMLKLAILDARAKGDPTGGETAQYLGLSDEQFEKIKRLRRTPR